MRSRLAPSCFTSSENQNWHRTNQWSKRKEKTIEREERRNTTKHPVFCQPRASCICWFERAPKARVKTLLQFFAGMTASLQSLLPSTIYWTKDKNASALVYKFGGSEVIWRSFRCALTIEAKVVMADAMAVAVEGNRKGIWLLKQVKYNSDFCFEL